MKINRENLYLLYMDRVIRESELCSKNTQFTAEDCVNMVVDVLENNTKSLVELTTDDQALLLPS